MTDSMAVFYDERFIKYDFGADHPLHQERILLHYELSKSMGLLDASGISEPPFEAAADEQLQLVHTKEYIEWIRNLSNKNGYTILDNGDTRAFPGAYDIARLLVGGTLAAVDTVMQNKSEHAWNPGGGLHHAHADRAAGFCIFNDVAIACHYLKKRYKIKRILYLDIDVHHADGVQEQFYDDPTVLTLSIHETGRILYPRTGFTEEIGIGEGKGYSVNLPLPPFTRDEEYLEAFEAIVPPIIEVYKPEVILMQNGVDTHYQDELGHLILTTKTFAHVANRIHTLTHKHAQGRLIAVGGGGYSYLSVPRCWTLILATLAGYPLKNQIPREWQQLFKKTTGLQAPTHVRDSVVPTLPQVDQGRVSRIVTESVSRVKGLIFPLIGIEN